MQQKNTRMYLFLLLFLVSLSFQSCIQHREMIVMDQGKIEEDIRSYKEIRLDQSVAYKSYKLQAYDQLIIRINAFDGSTEEFLGRSFATENGYSSNIDYNPSSLYFTSYNVDETGHITLPILGKVKVEGMTVDLLKEKLDEDYNPYLKFAATTVKLANMRVTILGEINDPGVHYLYNEKTTLLDAVSLADDFTDFANLERVKLVRQTKEGTKTVFINLGQPDFIYSEYYYIRPYDLIYVEPLKAKALDSSARSLGAIISAASVVAIIINALARR